MESKQLNWGHVSQYRTELMGFACIWIMASHNIFVWPESFGWYWVKKIFEYGNLGVEIFLLVSGVGLYYAGQRTPSLKQFYFRRYIRLIVPYMLIAAPYWIFLNLHIRRGDWYNLLMDVTQLSFPFKGVSPLGIFRHVVFSICCFQQYLKFKIVQMTLNYLCPEK